MTNKKISELINKYEKSEAASAFVFPVSERERREANTELSEVLKARRAAMTGEEKLRAGLMQLRFQIEDYLKDSGFSKAKTFSYFLQRYIATRRKKRNEFAQEISITPAVLSQYANNYRKPTEEVLIRLELHCNNIISASYWFQLLQKEELHKLKSNKHLRAEQKRFVSHIS